MDLGNSPDPQSKAPTRIDHHHFKECLKNHAATLGRHALDGCGEFMPSPASLKCAACGCHRNFHRRLPPLLPPPNAIPALEYQPHHRHHPPPPPARGSSPTNSPSPPPISSSYYHSALLALNHGLSFPLPDINTPISSAINATTPMLNSRSRKRCRTKFTQFQKDKMLEFAEKVEWKMQKRDEDAINGFCGKFGLDRGVFKVWMHNNKNLFAKKDQPPPPPHLSDDTTEISTPTINGNGVTYCTAEQHDGDRDSDDVHGQESESVQLHLPAHAHGTNGSST